MRTKLRSKVTLLFLTFGLLLAVPAVALADRFDADADTLATATPAANTKDVTQQPGTTQAYPFSAAIQETGANTAADNVFVNTGDKVTVNNTFGGDWVNAAGSTLSSFEFTAYGQNKSGTISIKVPCDAVVGVAKPMTVTLDATASNGNTLNGDPQTITYNVTPTGSPNASCPTADAGGPYSGNEGTDIALSGSGTDPENGPLTYAWDLDNDGQFDDSTAQNPNFAAPQVEADTDYTVKLQVTDNQGLTDTDTATVTVRNIVNTAPNVGNITGDNSANEGQTKSYSVSATDPDGDALSYAWSITSGGSFAHIDGAANTNSASLVFDDGPGTVGLQVVVNDGNDHPVTKNLSISVNNVAPTTTLSAANPTSVNESSTTEHTYSYTISDPGTDTVSSVSTSCGTNGEKVANSDSNTDTSGSFKCKFDDGSSTKQSAVSAQATDSDNDPGNNATQTVNIANVAPTVTNVSALVQNVLSGNNVSFTGTATDPSGADTTAGFSWQWSKDGGTYAAGSNPFSASFSTCGSHSVSAKATDKDGDTSAAVSSGNVNVYTAPFKAPLVDGSVNTVQKGRVIPVKISVGCGTNLLTGLAPRIDLLSGDVSPESESGSTAVTTSVSSADTGQTMREVDGGYIYNLQVPSTAGKYTIRVNPWGVQTSAAAWSASSNYIVLDVRSK